MPKVINRHHYRGKPLPRPFLYVGRGTPLGNPFTVKDYGDEALALYRQWLWSKIQANDRAVVAELRKITAATHVVCSCAPRPCHADVIVRAWNWFRATG